LQPETMRKVGFLGLAVGVPIGRSTSCLGPTELPALPAEARLLGLRRRLAVAALAQPQGLTRFGRFLALRGAVRRQAAISGWCRSQRRCGQLADSRVTR